MACFLVSAAEAAAVTALKKAEEKKEQNEGEKEAKTENISIPMSEKLRWLSNLLWGGAALLMFEHVWHGEVVPWFPFLTAMSDPADTAEMLHEMATVGVCMALLITAVWFVMCKAADALVKRQAKDLQKATV